VATLRVEVASAGQVEAVARIMRGRLNGIGILPRRVDVTGPVITFGLPVALTADEVRILGRSGFLAFRPVLQSLAPNGSPGTGPAVDCGVLADRDRVAVAFGGSEHAGETVVSCGADGLNKFLLGPAEMTGIDIKTAQATLDTGTSEWIIRLEMKSAADWAALTEKYTQRQLAIVLDGTTQSAPTINERIPDGTAQISGTFTEKEAGALAAVLKYGALPARVTISTTGPVPSP
jgi:preprotein translocase subunit SecD